MSSITYDCNTGSEVLDALNEFLTVGHTLAPVYDQCTGNCYIDDAIGTATSVYEQITITFTSPTDFNVVGSSSDSMGTGTVGSKFVHPRVSFTIQMPSQANDLYDPIPCQAGDKISIIMTQPWSSEESGPLQYRWSAPGNDGMQNINIGLSGFSDGTGGYHNARIYMFPKWKTGVAWASQPNVMYQKVLQMGPAGSQARTLYAVADGKFCYVVVKINTVYCGACFGWYDSVNTFDVVPQPMICGGSYYNYTEPDTTSTAWQWVNSNCAPGLIFGGLWAGDSGGSNNSYIDSNGDSYSNPLASSESTHYVAKILTYPNIWLGCCRECGNYDVVARAGNWVSRKVIVQPNMYNATYACMNMDGTVPTFPQWIYRLTDSEMCRGPVGGIPMVKMVPVYKYDNTLITAGTVFRSKPSRTKHMFTPVGSSTTNMYALEMV